MHEFLEIENPKVADPDFDYPDIMETPIELIKKKQQKQNVIYGIDPAEEAAKKERDKRKFYEERADSDRENQKQAPKQQRNTDDNAAVNLGV